MQSDNRQQTISLLVAMGIVGLGIGWLVGLSLSPVIANVITALVTATAAILAAVNGLENKENAPLDTDLTTQDKTGAAIAAAGRLRVNPWPLAALLIGVFFATTVGIYARTNDILGNRVSPEMPPTAAELKVEVERWVTQGMSKTVVVERLFDLRYPPYDQTSASTSTSVNLRT